MRFYRQLDAMDCGPTCLRMIASHYGKNLSLHALRDRTSVTRTGVSLLDLADAAEDVGFRTLPARVAFATLREEAPLPAVVHWRQRHFLVVVEFKRGKVRIADPAVGPAWVDEATFLRCWAGESGAEAKGAVLLLEPTPALYEEEASAQPASHLRHLVRYLAPLKGSVLQIAAGMLAVSGIQLLLPFLTQAMVDHGVTRHDLTLIRLILLGQVVLFVSRALAEAVQARILLHTGARVSISIAADLLRKITRLPVTFFDSRLFGDINVRLADHREIERFLAESVVPAVGALLSLIAFSVVLALYDWRILTVHLGGSVLAMVWVLAFQSRLRSLAYARIERSVEMQNAVAQMVRGILDLKVYDAVHVLRWRWERNRARLHDVATRQLGSSQAQDMGARFFEELKDILITFLAAQRVIAGDLTLGMMLAIQYVVGQLRGPVSQLRALAQSSVQAGVSLERSLEVHDMPDEDAQARGTLPASELALPLRARELCFRYGGDRSPPVLNNLSFEVPANKVTAIVGASGSGKTTLLKLLLKFYEPTGGQIKAGDYDLRAIRHRHWQRRCAAVLQEGYVFTDTIANNIALGAEAVDRERLVHAATVANALEFIEESVLGFDRVVGSDGEGLSRGQQQRLLIARAVYADTPYLFLDEATNSLDARNEAEIMTHLEGYLRGRTVVIVAHRLSTVRGADQILVLDKGEIVERGSHESLVALRGNYFRLVKNQLELGL